MYPRRSPTTHTEQLGAEASVYDWARGQVHALNPTAAFVWRQCDGATSPAAIAAALRRERDTLEADAVVELTLAQFARHHLLELPVEARGDRPATSRRWLIGRGVAAAMLPAIYSIVAPSPVDAQSPGPAPTLTSVTPNQGVVGTTVAVTLTGTNFVAGATVTVSGAGVTVTSVVVGGSTSLTANFVVDAAAAAGARTVTVTTPGGTSGGQTFTITLPVPGAPTLTSVAPNQGVVGTTVAVTLTGTNFVIGATTVKPMSGVTINSVVVSSATSLTANFVIDAAAATGARTVTVTTAGGTSGGQTFTINAPAPGAPTLTSVAPNQGIRGTTVAVTLTGTNFVVGAGLTTVNISGTGVTVSNVSVGSSTSLTANFVLDGAAALGARNVTVTTAGGTSGGQTFTINAPAPTLTSVAPNQGIRGTTVAVTLTGTNFVVGAALTTVSISGTGVTVSNVSVGSSTSLTANFVLDPTAAPGGRAVTVTTADGTSGPQTFTVGLLAPTLTNISPNQATKGIQATTVAVTLTGTNFVVGATTVNVSGAGLTVNTIVVNSNTSLTANFVLDPAAAVGPRSVTVTTAFGTSGAQTFTINPGSMSFAFTNAPQSFTVPPGVTTLTVTAQGAQGGPASNGGQGGSVTATLTVSPGEILNVFVGGQGGRLLAFGTGASGGFNGGGAGGTGNFSPYAGGGGGASDVRRGGGALSNRVVVAGGGGGATFSGIGGLGGGTTGGAGTPAAPAAGGGGTQSTGGSGGTNSPNNGLPGATGTGGQGGPDSIGGAAGGGGGGGYWGGGGGAGSVTPAPAEAGTGGGGSSFPPGAVHTQGNRAGNGAVTITW